MPALKPSPNEWSDILPIDLKLAISNSIIQFSRMETALIEALWAVESANLERKKKISRDFIKRNINKMRQHVEGLPGVKTKAIWRTLELLLDERNIISHGYWLWSDGRPLVVWHSKFLETDDEVGAEWFEMSRFNNFLIKVEHLKNLFNETRTLSEKFGPLHRNK